MRGAPDNRSQLWDLPWLLHPDDLPRDEAGFVDWSIVFGREAPLRIEVGVGNSPFLIAVAEAEPGFNYLGFEYSRKRTAKFLKRVEKSGLDSIRMLPLNADDFLSRSIATAAVDHLFLNHPDPWPKRRHEKKRFARESNNEVLARIIRPGGGYSLRTDAPLYAEQMLATLDGSEFFENLSGPGRFAPAPRFSFETPYEIKFKAAGLPIYYLEYRRSSAPAGATEPR